MTLNDTYREVYSITQAVIQNGLSVQERFPKKLTDGSLTWEGQTDISVALKNIPYEEKYRTLDQDRNYNFKMLDGALIQFMYQFKKNGRDLLTHRLSYMPAPHFERYEDQPDLYETNYFGDSDYHDQIEKNIITSPVRFDFNASDKLFVEVDHPYTHTHFGEFECCRIPVVSPITPSIFFNFILRNYYNYAIKKKGEIVPVSSNRFPESIVRAETGILHFSIK